MSVSGIDDVVNNFNSMLSQITLTVEETMHGVTQDLKGKSQQRAPKDIGTLRGSASATVKREAGNIVGEVGFGEEYALIQHESLNFHHENGQAKYLEGPLIENQNQYLNDLRNSVGDVLK